MFLAYGRRGMMVRAPFVQKAMRAIHAVGGTALFHCEDGDLIDALEDAAVTSGRTAPEHYAATRPSEAEASAIGVVSFSATETGCPTYIVHVSSAAGLAAVERARERGVPLWAETCPQYILLDDEAMRRFGPAAKIAPPLRTAADRLAIGTGLRMGAINTVGSDHASYSQAAKTGGAGNIFAVPFGMPGAPTLWPSMYSWAVEQGVPLPHLVRAMAEMPARVFGLSPRKGTLQPGGDGDIILVDPSARKTVDAEAIWPHVCPSPLAGAVLAGWPHITISRGDMIWHDGKWMAEPGRGHLVAQEPRK
jgi:dihydroorotase-like cyclic amidohydrolase